MNKNIDSKSCFLFIPCYTTKKSGLLFKMRVFLILLFIQKCLTFDLPRENCKTDITIDKDNYNVSQSYDVGDTLPSDAHYDNQGNLFFVTSGINLDGYYFNIKVIKSNTTEAQEISGLPQGESYSIAIDRRDDKVYFGTRRGIFLYEHIYDEAKLISKPDLRLNNIYIDKDGNKFVTDSPDGVEELYLLAGDKKIRFKTLDDLKEMSVDEKNNYYYIKNEKLFVLKSNLTKPLFIGDISYEGFAQISFKGNKIYVASETLSYIHENDTGPLKLVKNIPGKVTAIAFDSTGDFVLGTEGKLLKYKIMKNKDDCGHVN